MYIPQFDDPISIDAQHFPDEIFREYISTRFDKNADGVLSIKELLGVGSLEFLFSEISSLEGIEYFPALKELTFVRSQLSSLDVSRNTKLEYLSCGTNQLSSLDVSKNTALEYLFCESSHLTSLDLTNNTAVTYYD